MERNNSSSSSKAVPHLLCVSQPEAQPYLKNVTRIYTDLDGTLLAPGGKLLASHSGKPSSATAKALVALKQANIEVVIVTGRNSAQANEFLRCFNLHTYISELGSVCQLGTGGSQQLVYELGDWANTVVAQGLTPGELPQDTTPYQLTVQSGVVERLLSAFAGKLEPFAHNPHDHKVAFPLRGHIDVSEAKRILSAEKLPLELHDNGILHSKAHALASCLETHIYHLLPRGVSKAFAIKADMERSGLAQEQALAIGDAPSDVEMGDFTGCLVVMGSGLNTASVQAALTKRYALAKQQGRDATTLYTVASTADGWVEFAQALLATR